MSVRRDLWRVVASFVRPVGGSRFGLLALCYAGLVGGAGESLAQSEQQARCMQLQQELAAAHGITVNTIPPGLVDTPMARIAEELGKLPSVKEIRAMMPLNRVGTSEEFDADHATGVAGQAIRVEVTLRLLAI